MIRLQPGATLSDALFPYTTLVRSEMAGHMSLGIPFATPVFDGAREADVSAMLERAGLDRSGQVDLYDGRSGDRFDRKVTVGYMYVLDRKSTSLNSSH